MREIDEPGDRLFEAGDAFNPESGPLTDKSGVVQVRDYLSFVEREATERFHAGMDAWDAARDIALHGFADWGERGRISVNVDTVYRTLDPNHVSPNVIDQFKRMAALDAPRHG